MGVAEPGSPSPPLDQKSCMEYKSLMCILIIACCLLQCSLGISLLELACELEPPSSGKNWHLLREGRIPPHLLTGMRK